MPEVILLSDLKDKRIEPYLWMRRPREMRERGEFVAEGIKVVERLMAAQLEVKSLLVPLDAVPEIEALTRLYGYTHIKIYAAPKPQLEQMVGFPLYQGVMALACVPRAISLQELWENTTRPRLWIAIDGLTNAENVGVVVRNAAALGAQGLLVGKGSSSPWLRRAVRCSMGGVFALKIIEGVDLVQAAAWMRSCEMKSIAVEITPDAQPLWQLSAHKDVCLFFGQEVGGVKKDVLCAVDGKAYIPMSGNMTSINVANAVAVALYEVARQRQITTA
ncbi:MAG: RNA methyltransferase [Methylacidiphilales bacterium]|nr:RNA methyltransferase [Candidatus Methylacidiphilales bacterium]MDW8349946.1 RNA methyltransferase [Verrucomicrobiae bacterium]